MSARPYPPPPEALAGLEERERQESGVSFNPFSPAVWSDPYPSYAALRERDPVHRSHVLGAWVVSRYRDIEAILVDVDRFSSSAEHYVDEGAQEISPGRPQKLPASNLVSVDPPDHTRLRHLASKAFLPRLAGLTSRMEEITEELLTGLAEGPGESFDVVGALANPLPARITAELLGMSAEDREHALGQWMGLVNLLDQTAPPDDVRKGILTLKNMSDRFQIMIDERRTAPTDDLVSDFLVERDGDRLSEEEVVTMLRLFFIAGTDTTTGLISNSVLQLLRHPGELARLRADPSLLRFAVQELLRFDTPVQLVLRYAREEAEIGGRRIRRGQKVVVLLGSANRDPEACEDPDQLDLSRRPAARLSFGRGPHLCLGAPMAQKLTEVALAAVLRRFPDLSPSGEAPVYGPSILVRRLERLVVRADSGDEGA